MRQNILIPDILCIIDKKNVNIPLLSKLEDALEDSIIKISRTINDSIIKIVIINRSKC